MLAALLLHVTLSLPPGALRPDTFAYAVDEAAAIWAPYGVVVDAVDPCEEARDREATRLTIAVVTAADATAAPGSRRPLAAITFDGASPGSTITLYLAAVLQFIRASRTFGAEDWKWPARMRDPIVGRVIGRVLAHEIGHYVLQTPVHTGTGLMRAVQTPDSLVAPSRGGFELSADAAWRLSPDGRKEKGPASAGPEQETRAKR